MWRPWSKALEALGRLRLRTPFRWRRTLQVGDPQAPDAEGSTGWREYVDAERLYDVWGPHPESPWVPYHCVPLFAALDSLKRESIGPSTPTHPDVLSTPAHPDAPSTSSHPDAPRPTLAHLDSAPPWLRGDTWTILDLPGPICVEAAAWLITGTGCQPVCTFDNWPHAKGVLRAEAILAELLRWATTIARVRPSLNRSSPPLWICDSERLGARTPSPRQFDNRYYLDDSILPGAGVLRDAGIGRLVYVTMTGEEPPVSDLDECFKDLLSAGTAVLRVGLADPLREPWPLTLPAARFKSPKGFRRSSAGGFGQTVPDPSSGSSG